MDKEQYQILKHTMQDCSCPTSNQYDIIRMLEQYEGRQFTREDIIKRLLSTIPGEDISREGIQETPQRVARMYEEIFSGYCESPEEILSKTFATDVASTEDIHANGIVAVNEIPFFSHCEHHMVPFYGHAWIAYIPNDRVVGLSKMARLLECYAKRLQIQERLTTQIADAMERYLQPQGVMVVIRAEHLCMAMRGVKKPGTTTTTSVVRGAFIKPEVKAECMSLFNLK